MTDVAKCSFKERALLLGERETMVGIASEPGDGLRSSAPLFLFFNAGIVHRIGPHRNVVQVARGLAAAGFRAVRVDLSGIGDSAARRDNLDFAASAQADIKELLVDLESLYGTERFVLAGICSGADNAYQAAVQDKRVVGAVLVDGYAYRTRQFYWRHYQRRLMQRSLYDITTRAAEVLMTKARKVAGKEQPAPLRIPSELQAVPDYVRAFPPREEVAQQLRELVARNFSMLWIYSGGMARYVNYERQLRDAFADVAFGDCLAVKHLPNANHTFTALRTQRVLVESVAGWARKTY